jgi:hypothetical protein
MKDRFAIEGFESNNASASVTYLAPGSQSRASSLDTSLERARLLAREARLLAGRHLAQREVSSSLANEVARINGICARYRRLKSALTSGEVRAGANPELASLMENDYFVDAQVAELVRASRSYPGRKLPMAANDGERPAARIYAIAEHLFGIAHGVLDRATLLTFLQSYQEFVTLELGELWLLPDMCALVALERTISGAERYLSAAAGPCSPLPRSDASSLGDLVMSLRFVEVTNWNGIIGTISLTEKVLRQDPSGHYALMDAETRNGYRQAAVKLARAFRATEIRVVQAAIELARLASEGRAQASDPHERHVGYYLIGDGVERLASRLGQTVSLARSARRAFGGARSVGCYVSCHVGAALLLWAGAAAALAHAGAQVAMAVLLGLLTAAALNQALSAAVNAVIGRAPQARLPRLDYQNGIPAQAMTCVTVPCLLESAEVVHKLLVQIENHFLSNRSDHLHFALLSDFPDAPASHTPGDAPLLRQAVEGIRRLNETYCPDPRSPIFHLVHRDREWNAQEGAWMGFERKRGKLLAFNRLLLRGDGSAFSVVEGAFPGRPFRYAIVLDGDTQLPWNTATTLAGIMDHPLHRPRVDAAHKQVTAGYTLIQPALATAPPSAGGSWYALLWGGRAGLDPYSHAKANTYHDLFAEGSYHGKGIYDIAAFDAILADRFPDNRILSHDLIEGCYARCTIASDVYLLEEHPHRYVLDVMRQLRWMRGDWQIAAWLRSRVPTKGGARVRNTLSLLSRYKIFDNLARSLVEPAMLMALLASTLAGTSMPFIAAGVALPFVLPAAWGMASCTIRHLRQTSGASSPVLFRRDLAGHAMRAVLGMACLPYYGLLGLWAVFVTAWRLKISKQHLLAWRTYSQSKRLIEGQAVRRIAPHHLSMLAANLAFSATLCSLETWLVLDGIGYCMPWIALWLAAPAISSALGAARSPRRPSLNDSDRTFLRLASRRTWAFFEDALTSESHWLPPDHLLQLPSPHFARRTSPTNLGLGLLAICAACDLGYCGLWDAVRRLERSLLTISRLDRHLGHLYNWYDIDTLQPLSPRYVSTVDSGNFVAHLMVARQFLREARLADEPIAPLFQGLADTLQVLKELAPQTSPACGNLQILIGESLAAAARGEPIGQLRQHAQELLREVQEIAAIFHDGQAADHVRRLIVNAENLEREIRLVEAAQGGDLAFSHRVSRLIRICDELISADFGIFFDRDRGLLSLGMDAGKSVCDAGHYDMLASEARLTAFVAVAKGDVHSKLWYALGRLHTKGRKGPVLLSWSGSMFEYLMPDLVMPSIDGTLLDASASGGVRRQIHDAQDTGLPWGVSESGYAEFEDSGNYCYQAFGLPSLGLQPGLGERRVVAPYASALATMREPVQAIANLRRLAEMGAFTHHGFYEAIDFGSNGSGNLSGIVVMEHMAHHQGMALLAFANVLTNGAMQARFARDPELRAAQILLAERIPERCDIVTRLD